MPDGTCGRSSWRIAARAIQIAGQPMECAAARIRRRNAAGPSGVSSAASSKSSAAAAVAPRAGGALRRSVELRGHRFVRSFHREREMTGALLDVRDLGPKAAWTSRRFHTGARSYRSTRTEDVRTEPASHRGRGSPSRPQPRSRLRTPSCRRLRRHHSTVGRASAASPAELRRSAGSLASRAPTGSRRLFGTPSVVLRQALSAV